MSRPSQTPAPASAARCVMTAVPPSNRNVEAASLPPWRFKDDTPEIHGAVVMRTEPGRECGPRPPDVGGRQAQSQPADTGQTRDTPPSPGPSGLHGTMAQEARFQYDKGRKLEG